MSKVRVLVVDDAVVIRKIVTDVLTGDPELEIAGTAANGKIALQKIPMVKPDIIILDVEMPEMDGLETLRAVRDKYRHLPVIMSSTLTERGAATTIEALSRGASDYVCKPANVGSVVAARERIKEELIPKLKGLCAYRLLGSSSTAASMPSGETAAPRLWKPPQGARQPTMVQIVAIGVSTGGPTALAEVLRPFTADFPVPIVIVQHMPPVFTGLLAERLNDKSGLGVREGAENMVVEAGHAYIAPGGSHMELRRCGTEIRIVLNQEPPENSCRPSVDPLFRSVVQLYGSGTLAVILTGMGRDGYQGCECVRRAHGQIICQDKATSVVWGMPGFVAEAGIADAILPLPQVADEILQRTLRLRSAAGPAVKTGEGDTVWH